ncbi:MAG: hypothetical protein ACYTER_10765, partial [Planctomycetota bacterium]
AEKLDEEENEFLDAMGIDFDKFNEFAMTYVPPPRPGDSGDSGPDDSSNIDDGDSSNPDETPDNEPEEYQWDWDKIPRELWGLIESLTGAKPPY